MTHIDVSEEVRSIKPLCGAQPNTTSTTGDLYVFAVNQDLRMGKVPARATCPKCLERAAKMKNG